MENESNFTESHESHFSVFSLIEDYGWYIFIAGVALGYCAMLLKPYIMKILKEKEERDYAAKYHKDPDVVVARLNAQQAAVDKMQEKYRKDAEEYKKKMEEKEAKKMQEWVDRQSTSNGGRLGSSSGNSSKGFKPEYNPLMGGGTIPSYRPQRRTPCSGGGCGQ